MTTKHEGTWRATRYEMSCSISVADLLQKIDDGAEQVSETVFVYRGWVIRQEPPTPRPDAR